MDLNQIEQQPGNLDRLIRKATDNLQNPGQIKATIPEYLKALQLLKEMGPEQPVHKEILWVDPEW